MLILCGSWGCPCFALSHVYFGAGGEYLTKKPCCAYPWCLSSDIWLLCFYVGIKRDKRTMPLLPSLPYSQNLRKYFNVGITWGHMLWFVPLNHLPGQILTRISIPGAVAFFRFYLMDMSKNHVLLYHVLPFFFFFMLPTKYNLTFSWQCQWDLASCLGLFDHSLNGPIYKYFMLTPFPLFLLSGMFS